MTVKIVPNSYTYFLLGISAYVDGRYADCMHQSESCLNTMKSFTEIQVPNLMSVIAKLHSYVGNAAIETRDYLTALDHHERDLLIGEEK